MISNSEKQYNERLKDLSKADQKRSIEIRINKKEYRLDIIKKELTRVKQMAKEKGPHSFESESRLPQKINEYSILKKEIDRLKRKLAQL